MRVSQLISQLQNLNPDADIIISLDKGKCELQITEITAIVDPELIKDVSDFANGWKKSKRYVINLKK